MSKNFTVKEFLAANGESLYEGATDIKSTTEDIDIQFMVEGETIDTSLLIYEEDIVASARESQGVELDISDSEELHYWHQVYDDEVDTYVLDTHLTLSERRDLLKIHSLIDYTGFTELHSSIENLLTSLEKDLEEVYSVSQGESHLRDYDIFLENKLEDLCSYMQSYHQIFQDQLDNLYKRH